MSEETALTTDQIAPVTDASTELPPVPPAGGADPSPAANADAPGEGDASGSDDWRTPFTGGDDKVGELFNRYNSPEELGKAMLEQRKTISERQGATIPGEGSSDEQIRAFNEAHSIPERADGYDIQYKAPEAFVDETDAPFLQAVREDLHAKGGILAHPGVMEAVHEKFYEIKQAQLAHFEKGGAELSKQNIRELKEKWGAEYDTNISLAKGALQTYADLADPNDFLSERMADGTSIGDNPTMIQMLARFARATGEDAIFTKAAGVSDAKGLQDRINELKGLRDTDPDAYAKAQAPGGELYRLMGLKARKSAA